MLTSSLSPPTTFERDPAFPWQNHPWAAHPWATLSTLERGILQAVSYSDVFDFPLTLEEIHHNLIGTSGALSDVQAALDQLVPVWLECRQDYYTLPGRLHLVAVRQRRAKSSAALWPHAIRQGRSIARFPFVRMVAVTGALSVNNAKENDDIDYLVVTDVGRLWLCRALIILLVKRAERRGELICPNYFLTTKALALPERDLFTAHELLQMVPIAGRAVFREMIALNSWAREYLPNAYANREKEQSEDDINPPAKRILERALRTAAGDWLEHWEMRRKIRKFGQQATMPPAQNYGSNGSEVPAEVSFSADRCKGHFNRHGNQALGAYKSNLAKLAEEK